MPGYARFTLAFGALAATPDPSIFIWVNDFPVDTIDNEEGSVIYLTSLVKKNGLTATFPSTRRFKHVKLRVVPQEAWSLGHFRQFAVRDDPCQSSTVLANYTPVGKLKYDKARATYLSTFVTTFLSTWFQ